MTYAETIRRILVRNHFTLKQIAIMCGISCKRLEEIANFDEPTDKEKHCIDIFEKFVYLSNKSLNYEDDIEYQKKQVDTIRTKIIGEDEEIADTVDSLIAESMYLGLFYANNMQDSVVEKLIKKVRCVK